MPVDITPYHWAQISNFGAQQLMNMTETSLTTHIPMIRKYLRIKAEQPNMLVFCRMGDFY